MDSKMPGIAAGHHVVSVTDDCHLMSIDKCNGGMEKYFAQGHS